MPLVCHCSTAVKVKPHQSPHCEYKGVHKSLVNQDIISDHISSHGNQKPHKCLYCDYNTAYKGNLRNPINKCSARKGRSLNKVPILNLMFLIIFI